MYYVKNTVNYFLGMSEMLLHSFTYYFHILRINESIMYQKEGEFSVVVVIFIYSMWLSLTWKSKTQTASWVCEGLILLLMGSTFFRFVWLSMLNTVKLFQLESIKHLKRHNIVIHYLKSHTFVFIKETESDQWSNHLKTKSVKTGK